MCGRSAAATGNLDPLFRRGLRSGVGSFDCFVLALIEKVRISVRAKLAEWRSLSSIDCFDRRAADVRKYQPAHLSFFRLARYIDCRCVTSHAAPEVDRPFPARCFSKHQIDVFDPVRKLKKFRRPNDFLLPNRYLISKAGM